RGHERDLSGFQTIHPVPLPRSRTPAEPTIPSHWRSRRCCPCFTNSKGFSVVIISGLPRGFNTCCLRFTRGVAPTHSKLASRWLACLYREGVEPLDRDERFLNYYISSPLPGFSLTLW